ncbi:hypothetical protein NMG60_11005018 [Bertholletia excelsa]
MFREREDRLMGGIGWGGRIVVGMLLLVSVLVSAESSLKGDFSSEDQPDSINSSNLVTVLHSLWKKGHLGYPHVWPGMRFGWKIVVGTVIGFFGAAFGSVGGVGGGGIFVPMLTLIIGFDTKSSTALSKCMITGASAATVFYNLRQKHPTLDLPVIDYDLALLFQPMLVLGISIGVGFNVIFADWMVTILLIILFLGLSTKAFFKGVETWKKETILNKEVSRRLASKDNKGEEIDIPQGQPGSGEAQTESKKEDKTSKVSVMENIRWKEVTILVAVWIIILALQIAKNYTTTCSAAYWASNLLQVPVAVGASGYEAVSLYRGRRVIASRGDARVTHWRPYLLVLYCCCGVIAGIVGGLLGLGGGFIMGPLFLEMGIPPQVASATATFVMMFSSSMSVIEYHLLRRFPIPYALYLAGVATIAALVGQHVVRKVIALLGRASLIIFTLALTVFVSAMSLGGVGISKGVKRMRHHEYMGFNDICAY